MTAEVAVLHDSDSWWGLDSQGLPSSRLDYHGGLRRAHRALWDAGVTVDFAHPAADLTGYRVVLAPALHVLSDRAAENLRAYVESGGTLLVQYFSGVVDEHYRAHLGGYPAAALRQALGIRVFEHRPLEEGRCWSCRTDRARVGGASTWSRDRRSRWPRTRTDGRR
ncbi:beta-galactosidase trimerization domain-containing protein [Streptacidiphilus monticola]